MKSIILIAVLAALTANHDAASVPEKVALTDLSDLSEEGFVYREDIDMYQKGEIRRYDILFFERELNLPPIPNTEQIEDVYYEGNSTTVISAVTMSRLPVVPGHTYVGALGTYFLNIRVRSGPGDGLYSRFQYYGHYSDWV